MSHEIVRVLPCPGEDVRALEERYVGLEHYVLEPPVEAQVVAPQQAEPQSKPIPTATPRRSAAMSTTALKPSIVKAQQFAAMAVEMGKASFDERDKLVHWYQDDPTATLELIKQRPFDQQLADRNFMAEHDDAYRWDAAARFGCPGRG